MFKAIFRTVSINKKVMKCGMRVFPMNEGVIFAKFACKTISSLGSLQET